jgi:hypothetical protein
LFPFFILSNSAPAFIIFAFVSPFLAMQNICFYRSCFWRDFSGNAELLLLPFLLLARLFGQCRAPAFTVLAFGATFRAMQSSCFYRSCFWHGFSGNAELLLLPFLLLARLFGQCRAPAFTVLAFGATFRAMQPLCFYRFPLVRSFSGNAALLLLPFLLLARFFKAMQSTCFYRNEEYHFSTMPIVSAASTCHQLGSMNMSKGNCYDQSFQSLHISPCFPLYSVFSDLVNKNCILVL